MVWVQLKILKKIAKLELKNMHTSKLSGVYSFHEIITHIQMAFMFHTRDFSAGFHNHRKYNLRWQERSSNTWIRDPCYLMDQLSGILEISYHIWLQPHYYSSKAK